MRIFEIEQDIAGEIQRNCSVYLDQMRKTKRYLYRGIRSGQPIIHAHSPSNRTPELTHSRIQKLIDKRLVEAGFTALRSNSIFTTSKERVTHIYGSAYYIFPYDSATFTWNWKADDFTTEWPIDRDFANRFFHDYGLKGESLPNSREDYTRDYRLKKFLDDVVNDPNFVKRYGFRNDDFASALESEHEILIHGEYYAVYLIDAPLLIPELFK